MKRSHLVEHQLQVAVVGLDAPGDQEGPGWVTGFERFTADLEVVAGLLDSNG